MYFYVLNFSNHTFKGFQFPEQVTAEINNLLANNVNEDEIEIINASDECARMSVKEFNNIF